MSVVFKKYDTTNAIKKATEKAILEACIKMKSTASLLAPVDTGRLSGSITYVTSTDRAGDLQVDPKEYEGYVGTNVEYAVYQEFGKKNIPPKPYLRPAAEQLKGGSAIAEVARILDDELTRAIVAGKVRKETFA